jgi:hypothetical protein
MTREIPRTMKEISGVSCTEGVISKEEFPETDNNPSNNMNSLS